MSPRLDREAARALVRRPRVALALETLNRDGEEARIVGGAVRNALIGRPIHDIDIATTALPEETMQRSRRAGFKAVPTGTAHGTVTVVVEGEPLEVTTLREDIETDGRHALVRFGRDFAADARRRDFTVNALSVDREGEIHDHTGGLADLEAGRIRFIGDAATRIREDYLRILRFFRFSAEYGGAPPDREGLAASIAGREGLARLSRERVRTELLKLVAAPNGPDVAPVMEQAGLLGRLVPCLGDSGRLARSAGLSPVLRLGAYLVRTTADAALLQDSLRLSKAEHAGLCAYAEGLARFLSRDAALDLAEVKRTAFLLGADVPASVLAITHGEPRPVVEPEAASIAARLAAGDIPVPRFPLTGAQLVAAGEKPGPAIGRRLQTAREKWLAAGCPDEWKPEEFLAG